jgi:enediyne polyketide synthase
LASLRGRAMGFLQIADSGTMLAIAAGPEEVRQLIEPFSKSLVISNYNSPGQTVVSGATEAASRLRASCTSRNIHCQLLQVSHAFHSDIVAPAAVEFREAMKSVKLDRLTGRVISTYTAAELSPDTDMKELLSQHIRRPVRFVEAVQCAEKLRPSLWLEDGPGGVLTNFVRAILGTRSVHCLPTDLSGEDGFHLLNNVLARAWVLGFPIATRQLFAHRFHRPFNVESYNPIFIVNPCERPLKAPETPVPAITVSLAAALLPENASRDDFADYLARRGAFLRELVALDFRHDGGAASAIVPAPASTAAVEIPQSAQPPAPSTAREEAPKDKDVLLAFAVEWIAKRTGFPTTATGLDLRMRDDLNLDSIKVGELVVLMAQKLGCALKGDRAYDLNSTLHQLVDFLFQNTSNRTLSKQGDRPEAALTQKQRPPLTRFPA